MSSPSQRAQRDRERRREQLAELRRTRRALREPDGDTAGAASREGRGGATPGRSDAGATLRGGDEGQTARRGDAVWPNSGTAGASATMRSGRIGGETGGATSLSSSPSASATRGGWGGTATMQSEAHGADTFATRTGTGGLGTTRRTEAPPPAWLGGDVTAPLGDVLALSRSQPLSPSSTLGRTAALAAVGSGDGAAGEPDVWVCDVQTGDEEHAGTKAAITLDVYGENGSATGVRLNANREKFARGTTVRIELRLSNDNLGRLYKIRVTSDNTGTGPDWLLSRIVLTHISGPNVVREPLGAPAEEAGLVDTLLSSTLRSGGLGASATLRSTRSGGGGSSVGGVAAKPLPAGIDTEHYVFDCDAWITKDVPSREAPARGPYVDPARLPKLMTYTVKTFTGKGERKRSPGTDAKVHVQLFGLLGDTGVRQLAHSDTHSDPFEEGHEDHFKIEAVHLGDLTKVVIGHDNSGGLRHQMRGLGDAGWFLDKVAVYDPSLPGDVEFPCDRWLDANKDDGKIERELPRARSGSAGDRFVVETKTCAKRGSRGGVAGPPWPWVTLTGSKGATKKVPLEPTGGKKAFRAGARDAFAFHAASVGRLRSVTVGYTPKHRDDAPWAPTAVWVTVDGHRSCWVPDGVRCEVGGKGWPTQRALVHRPEGDGGGSADDAGKTGGAATRVGGSGVVRRPHSVSITPSGLVVQCWDPPGGGKSGGGGADVAESAALTKKKQSTTDCWNTEFVPASTRKAVAKRGGVAGFADTLKAAFDPLEVTVEQGPAGGGPGMTLAAPGKRGAKVTSVATGGAASGVVRVGDVVASVNGRSVVGMPHDQLTAVVNVSARLDFTILRRRKDEAAGAAGKRGGQKARAATTAGPSMSLSASSSGLQQQQQQRHGGTAPEPSFSSTFRSSEEVQRAKTRRSESKRTAALRELMIDVPTACRDEYGPLRDKLAVLAADDKARVHDMVKRGEGHAHARAVWRLLCELHDAAAGRVASQLGRLQAEAAAAAKEPEEASRRHEAAASRLLAAVAGKERADAAKRSADERLLAEPASSERMREAVECGKAAAAAAAEAASAKEAESRAMRDLTLARARLKRLEQAAARAAMAASTQQGSLSRSHGGSGGGGADEGEDAAVREASQYLAKARRDHECALRAKAAGAAKFVDDSGVHDVKDAVVMTKKALHHAESAYAAATTAAAARTEAVAGAAELTALPAQGKSPGPGSRSTDACARSPAAVDALAAKILSVVGRSKTVLLSPSELHARLLDAGHRCSLADVEEVLDRSEPVRQLVEAQRRRRDHNEAAVKRWEQKKRAASRRGKSAARSERARHAAEARATRAHSGERVHYNAWAAALGRGVRPIPGRPAVLGTTDGGYVCYQASPRVVGPVQQQSWYHGAKQVADATWAMQQH